MTPHINLFVISGSGEPGFPYLVTMRLSRDIEIFVKRREIVVEINHKRVKRFPSSLFVLLRFGTDKQQVYRRNKCSPVLREQELFKASLSRVLLNIERYRHSKPVVTRKGNYSAP